MIKWIAEWLNRASIFLDPSLHPAHVHRCFDVMMEDIVKMPLHPVKGIAVYGTVSKKDAATLKRFLENRAILG